MTEVKRQSTAEDELDLIDLLKFLARKKVFILAIMFVCTLFSIFYAQSITPVYRATVGLLDHNESFSSSSVIEQLGLSDEVGHNTKSLNIFERFLFNVRSYELKQEVFVNGGFHKKFFRETGIDTDQSVSAIYNSTEIVKRNGVNYLELEGYKPKVMLEFLTALIEAAKENVNTEMNDIKRSIVNTKINNVVVQIKALEQEIAVQKQMKKQKITLQKREKIAHLSKALEMAKRMGIKSNNFDKPGKAPDWFRYGELALQQKIRSLGSKEEEEEIPNTENLSIKKLKLKKLQTADLPLPKFKVVAIGKHSYSLAKPNQTGAIVGFGVVFGLFIGIFMACFIALKNQLKTKEIPSVST